MTSFKKSAVLIFFLLFILLRKLNKLILPFKSNNLLIPLILVISGLFLQTVFLGRGLSAAEILGGSAFGGGLEADTLLVAANLPGDLSAAQTDEDLAGFFFFDSASLMEPNSPVGPASPDRRLIITYKIKAGDTLSSIAAEFGISLDTIIWANSGVKASALKVGSQLAILPVSGVRHLVSEGQTIETIANLYGLSQEQVLKYNKSTVLRPGEELILAGAKPRRSLGAKNDLPLLANYYAYPAAGVNRGLAHGRQQNAVDISNVCRTPIFASASGLVLGQTRFNGSDVKTSYGYNGGFGNVIVLEHPNDTKTLYAHLSALAAEAGDYVSQGSVIGYMGNTGLSSGCHLHFDIDGALNPLIK